MNQKKVVVAMSGGVDSSVAACLLQKEGYQIVGATMKLIEDEKTTQSIKDAEDVCRTLGVEHYVFDLQAEFKRIVITDFIANYQNGKTPNPCVVCNKHFKFGLFWEKAKELSADYIATGHYAKIENKKLKRSETQNKDQSYFLYGIKKEVLSHILFPLADYPSKDEVRKIAKNANLSVNSKKDSQEVCFVPNDDYIAYIEANRKGLVSTGDICLKDGTKLGEHQGVFHYTLGQRKGLGVSYQSPLYVTKLDTNMNQVIVGSNEDLNHQSLIADNINQLVEEFPEKIFAKVRSRGTLEEVKIEWINKSQWKATFQKKQRAMTPGQSIVLYDEEDTCLGGGIITEILD